MIYEEFRSDNAAAVRQILSFLGVNSGLELAAVHANPTVRLRSQTLDRAVHNLSVGRDPLAAAFKRPVKRVLPTTVRRRLLRVAQTKVLTAKARRADPGLVLELKRRFKPEVDRFGEYLGRDLVATWGYDGV